jgi:hypothetical protein
LNTASIIWRTSQTVSGLFEAKPSYGKDGDGAALENAQKRFPLCPQLRRRINFSRQLPLLGDKPNV